MIDSVVWKIECLGARATKKLLFIHKCQYMANEILVYLGTYTERGTLLKPDGLENQFLHKNMQILAFWWPLQSPVLMAQFSGEVLVSLLITSSVLTIFISQKRQEHFIRDSLKHCVWQMDYVIYIVGRDKVFMLCRSYNMGNLTIYMSHGFGYCSPYK